MAKAYSSFKDFFEHEEMEFRREIETVVHSDENIANNRLFVWNFEETDLEEFLEYFQIYKESTISISSRLKLSGNLMRKMNEMMREGYNPVECMLYASKTINMKLQNDKELQDLLAERIKDVYLKQEEETVAVLENIIKMWAWVPQIKVVITAIGLIGDNQELLDDILLYYGEDPMYKTKLFYAFMQNKTQNNLERVLKIIMNLQDCEEDNTLGKVFIKEISGFGYEGSKLIAKYYDNPGISRVGSRILKKIMFQDSSIATKDKEDGLYRNNLANKSISDDMAYKDFLEDCQKNYDDNAFYLCRFSRPDIGAFLKSVIEDENVSPKNRNTAIVSLGIIGAKGYSPAAAILDECERRGGNSYAVIVANVLLSNTEYVRRLVDIFCQKKDYELSELYSILRSANVVSYTYAVNLVASAFETKFRDLLKQGEYEQLNCLTANFQMFWDKKMFRLLSKGILDEMQNVLVIYAQNKVEVPTAIIISMIETVVHNWNSGVEKAIFALYKQSDNQKVQEVSFRKLKERKIEPPK